MMTPDKNKNLLNLIEKIAHEASESNLDFREKIAAADAVNEIAGFLSVSYDQAVLFSCILVLSLENPASLETLSRHFKCSIIKLISISHEIEALETMSLIKRRIMSSKSYNTHNELAWYLVPYAIIEGLKKSDKSSFDSIIKMSLPKLLDTVNNLGTERINEHIRTDQLLKEIELLLMKNQEHAFCNILVVK